MLSHKYSSSFLIALKPILTLSLLFVIGLITQPSAEASTTDLASGKQAYFADNFKLACDYLEQATAKEPKNAEAHYYYANALARQQNGAAPMGSSARISRVDTKKQALPWCPKNS